MYFEIRDNHPKIHDYQILNFCPKISPIFDLQLWGKTLEIRSKAKSHYLLSIPIHFLFTHWPLRMRNRKINTIHLSVQKQLDFTSLLISWLINIVESITNPLIDKNPALTRKIADKLIAIQVEKYEFWSFQLPKCVRNMMKRLNFGLIPSHTHWRMFRTGNGFGSHSWRMVPKWRRYFLQQWIFSKESNEVFSL